MKNILIIGSSSGIGNTLAKMLSGDCRVYEPICHHRGLLENFSAH